MWAALGLGLVVGALLGLVGGGGSIIAVPALVYGVGMEMSAAVPSSLVVVGISSAVAVVPRLRRGVDWPLALIVGASGALTTFAGAAVNRLFDQNVLLLLFAAIMVVAGIRMLFPTPSSGAEDDPGRSAVPRWRRNLLKALLTGVVVGFLTGLLGVGGGFLLVPALILVLKLPMSAAVGTSLVIIVINSLGGLVSHFGELSGNWDLTIAFTATAVAASLAATLVARFLSDTLLKRGFAVLVLLVAAFVAGEVFLSL